MRRALLSTLLSTLLLAACADEPLAVFVAEPLTDEQAEALDDAEMIIGHDIVMVNDAYGAVTIVWWDEPEPVFFDGVWDQRLGRTKRYQRGCRRTVRTIVDGESLAHEIGHAFGAEHVVSRGDVMYPRQAHRTGFDFSQADDFDRRLARFQACTVLVYD